MLDLRTLFEEKVHDIANPFKLNLGHVIGMTNV